MAYNAHLFGYWRHRFRKRNTKRHVVKKNLIIKTKTWFKFPLQRLIFHNEHICCCKGLSSFLLFLHDNKMAFFLSLFDVCEVCQSWKLSWLSPYRIHFSSIIHYPFQWISFKETLLEKQPTPAEKYFPLTLYMDVFTSQTIQYLHHS